MFFFCKLHINVHITQDRSSGTLQNLKLYPFGFNTKLIYSINFINIYYFKLKQLSLKTIENIDITFLYRYYIDFLNFAPPCSSQTPWLRYCVPPYLHYVIVRFMITAFEFLHDIMPKYSIGIQVLYWYNSYASLLVCRRRTTQLTLFVVVIGFLFVRGERVSCEYPPHPPPQKTSTPG